MVFELHIEDHLAADYTMMQLRNNPSVNSAHEADDLTPHKPRMTVIVIQAQLNIDEVAELPNVTKVVAK